MSLEERVKGGKIHYYFEYSERGRRRYMYLGSGERPKSENVIGPTDKVKPEKVKESLHYMRNLLASRLDVYFRLLSLLPKEERATYISQLSGVFPELNVNTKNLQEKTKRKLLAYQKSRKELESLAEEIHSALRNL